ANTFKDDPTVVFDLFNEPYPDRATSTVTQAWQCWRDGGTCPGIGYEVAGMQDLVDAVRDTGAKNLILAGGIAYSNDEPVADVPAHRPGGQSRRRLARVQLQHLLDRELLQLDPRPGGRSSTARGRGDR